MTIEAIALAAIRTDGGTQSRAALDSAWADELAAVVRDADGALDPVVVFYDGADYWLADGFHRVAAYARAGRGIIRAEVNQGTRRDAVLFACGANAKHGLRRTPADKRRAVETLLRDAEWSTWPQAQIAKACGVSREYVSRVFGEVKPSTCDRSQVTGADGRTINTANIGGARKPADPPAPPPAPAQRVEAPAAPVRPVAAPPPPPAPVERPQPAPVAAPVAPVVARVASPAAAPIVEEAPLADDPWTDASEPDDDTDDEEPADEDDEEEHVADLEPVEEPADEEPPVDARGDIVPERLRPAWVGLAEHAAAIEAAALPLRRAIEAMLADTTEYTRVAGKSVVRGPWHDLREFSGKALDAVRYAAREIAPQYLCADCGGNDLACKHCDGAGWTPSARVRERTRAAITTAQARAKAGVS